MNLWIETRAEELARVLQRVHLLLINDEEARLLSGEQTMVRAARRIRGMGPRIVIIKRGEYGALMF